MPANTSKIDRTSCWGNPFVLGEISPDEATLGRGTPCELCGIPVRDRAHAIELFRKWLYSPSEVALAWRSSVHVLRGRSLACWCQQDGPCHADVLLEAASGH